MTISRYRRAAAVLLVLGVAGIGIASTVSAASASATATTPKLAIQPSKIYYPCSEGNVTFSVSNFAADSSVDLYFGSTKVLDFAVIDTDSTGSGSAVVSFSDYYAGLYKVYATDGSLKASKSLTVSECP
ncbi:MAG: hypothetical protein ABSH30_12140 [Acidimicrobiales bacterium]|jgi:hypothetical protein